MTVEEKIKYLEDNQRKLRFKAQVNMANSLIDQFNTKRHLSLKQIEWLDVMVNSMRRGYYGLMTLQ